MNIELIRLKDNGISTVGYLLINNVFECFTLEDTYNFPKIHGKTRIPDGTYRIDLRVDSPMSNRYKAKYGDMHKGMLWLRGVPDFDWVYFHVGNREDDTDGCVLLGKTCSTLVSNQSISGSVLAYKDTYPKIAKAILDGENVTVTIKSL